MMIFIVTGKVFAVILRVLIPIYVAVNGIVIAVNTVVVVAEHSQHGGAPDTQC